MKPSFASSPARSIIRAKPAVLNGAPRSDVKTNAEFGARMSKIPFVAAAAIVLATGAYIAPITGLRRNPDSRLIVSVHTPGQCRRADSDEVARV